MRWYAAGYPLPRDRYSKDYGRWNILLTENLINPHLPADREFELWALPLKLKGGAIAAVARIL